MIAAFAFPLMRDAVSAISAVPTPARRGPGFNVESLIASAPIYMLSYFIRSDRLKKPRARVVCSNAWATRLEFFELIQQVQWAPLTRGRMTIRKQDLEALDSVFLALMCKKMSQDDKAAPDAREQAQKFKEEWFRLTEPETPPKNQKELDRAKEQLEDLRARMVDFLLPHVQASFAP